VIVPVPAHHDLVLLVADFVVRVIVAHCCRGFLLSPAIFWIRFS
jgi:hypothetical protein